MAIYPTYDEYQVVHSTKIADLEEKVTNATKDGWVVFGSLAVEPDNEARSTTFYQPMIRTKKDGAK